MIPRLLIISLTLVVAAGVLARASVSEPVPVRQSFDRFPMQIDSWIGWPQPPLEARILEVAGVDEYVNAAYATPGQMPVWLYVGYYQSQRQGDAIHSPLNCLPGAGWQPVSKGTLSIPVVQATSDDGPRPRAIEVNRYLIQKGTDRQLVLYWYQSHGRVVANEYWSKAYMILDAIRTNRTDAALMRVVSPVNDRAGDTEAAAERRAVAFVSGLFPILSDFLPS